MKSTFLALICLAVLCITLSLGLWPFHAPRNAVSWLANQDGLELGRNATLFSSLSLPAPTLAEEATVEIWLFPQRIWDSGTFLSFYQSGRSQFLLRQSQTDLLLQRDTQNGVISVNTARLYVDDLFRPKRPVFLTVTFGPPGVSIYLDGALAKTAPHFPLSAQDFAGRLILGDSAGQTDSWKGQLLGLAIYHRQFTPKDVLQNYTAWKGKGRPAKSEAQRPVLYLFDEHSGSIVHDQTGSDMDLYIPQTYQVIDKIFLEPVWSEFAMTRSYWSAALKNIVGFLPFGFCFYPYLLTAFHLKRPSLLTVLLGTTVSVTIEVLQGFLPTRDSGTTDILTNTLGTWIGVVCYTWFAPTLARIFPWFPFPAPARR